MIKQYRVTVFDAQGNPGILSFPRDNATIRKLLNGETIEPNSKHIRRVVNGEIIDDIPPLLVSRWLAKGWIEEVADGS